MASSSSSLNHQCEEGAPPPPTWNSVPTAGSRVHSSQRRASPKKGAS